MDKNLLVEKLAEAIGESVKKLPQPTLDALKKAREREEGGAKVQIETMLEAVEASRKENVPICQDTGTATFFVEVGKSFSDINEVGELETILEKSVRKATEEAPLRPNTVHPITGENAGDNTGRFIPYINWKWVKGSDLSIHFMPKGGGAENTCQFTAMTPGRGLKGVKEIVLERIATMEGKPCPPGVIGVGLGGGSNISMNIAKESLLRSVGERHEEERIAKLEEELLEKANKLGVGPMGVGGKTTVLDVHIEYAHRHPASFPVGIVTQCWCNRRAHVVVGSDGLVEVVN